MEITTRATTEAVTRAMVLVNPKAIKSKMADLIAAMRMSNRATIKTSIPKVTRTMATPRVATAVTTLVVLPMLQKIKSISQDPPT